MDLLKKQKRCFAFGCSYTEYVWPTFADLIGCNFEEYYNLGKSGSDNTYALNRLIDVHSLLKLDPKTDVVLFGVTSFGRFTYWHRREDWIGEGDYNFLPRPNDPKQNRYLENNDYSPLWSVYRSINAIKNFKLLMTALKIPHIIYPALDNVGFCLNQIYSNDRPMFDEWSIEEAENITKCYNWDTSIDEFTSQINNGPDVTYVTKDKFVENHPTTKTHYQYLQKFTPEFDTEITRSIVPIFDKKHWLAHEEITETMTKKFIFPYRDDLNLDQSLYLRKVDLEAYTPRQKYRDSGI